MPMQRMISEDLRIEEAICEDLLIKEAPAKLVGHLYAEEVGDGVLRRLGSLYDYVLAGNGVFLRAQRPGLGVQFQIAECEVRGLPALEDIFEWDAPPVPVGTVEQMLRIARREAIVDREILFHITWDSPPGWTSTWALHVPEQDAGPAHCKPLDDGPDSTHAKALIECHSHHSMSAHFSSMDDEDEQGFRIYAVLGRVLNEQAKISVRVGCHGYFFVIPAESVFELPTGLVDAQEQETFDDD